MNSDWTDHYETLKSGDVFEWEGIDGEHKVINVSSTSGGGVGMGAYPPTYTIMLDDYDKFTIDPWCTGKYRKFRVVGTWGHSPSPTTERYLSDKWLEETRAENEQRAAFAELKRKEAANVAAALDRLTPEERAAVESRLR